MAIPIRLLKCYFGFYIREVVISRLKFQKHEKETEAYPIIGLSDDFTSVKVNCSSNYRSDMREKSVIPGKMGTQAGFIILKKI